MAGHQVVDPGQAWTGTALLLAVTALVATTARPVGVLVVGLLGWASALGFVVHRYGELVGRGWPDWPLLGLFLGVAAGSWAAAVAVAAARTAPAVATVLQQGRGVSYVREHEHRHPEHRRARAVSAGEVPTVVGPQGVGGGGGDGRLR